MNDGNEGEIHCCISAVYATFDKCLESFNISIEGCYRPFYWAGGAAVMTITTDGHMQRALI